jgi:O-antigen ligase
VNKAARIAIVRVRGANPASPTRIRYVTVPIGRIPNPVQWSLLLLVATLPFEGEQFSFLSGFLSIPKISGLLLGAAYFFYNNPFSPVWRGPAVPSAMWWFLGYLAIYTLHGLALPTADLGSFISRFVTLLQLIVLFWIISNLLEEKLARRALLTFTISVTILALGTLFHLFGLEVTDEGGRAGAMGLNLNTFAILMALAAVTLIGLQLSGSFKRFTTILLSAGLVLPLLLVLVNTASRSGIGAFVIGSLAYVPSIPRSKRKFIAILIILIAAVATVYAVINSPVLVERWEQAFYEQNFSGRSDIYPAAIEMFSERPIFGWHPITYWYELGRRHGQSLADAHNLLLHLLLEVGLVGATPFLIGFCLCARAAWKARSGNFGSLPLAILLVVIAANAVENSLGLASKQFWFALAFMVAAASNAATKKHRSIGAIKRR